MKFRQCVQRPHACNLWNSSPNARQVPICFGLPEHSHIYHPASAKDGIRDNFLGAEQNTNAILIFQFKTAHSTTDKTDKTISSFNYRTGNIIHRLFKRKKEHPQSDPTWMVMWESLYKPKHTGSFVSCLAISWEIVKSVFDILLLFNTMDFHTFVLYIYTIKESNSINQKLTSTSFLLYHFPFSMNS